MTTIYTKAQLNQEARKLAKTSGGRFKRWELRIGSHCQLIVYVQHGVDEVVHSMAL